ncbi:UDP-glucose 4-epimerase GalE [Actinotalea solisilvae]|uniref:UDP-glucose 4-epimerase GalE n=1 Tax=Actinotalea solisilvae TaxID=2072922 RepID=UPI0018F1CB65|nr:UDP-glucose 4-epimerase GalE [Actinotalea solisilvae]
MKVVITGGAGYIGSTVASACLDRGWTPVILDDFSTGRREFVRGRLVYEGDVGDRALVERVFTEHPDIEGVVHCAARTVVHESVSDPLAYYRANVTRSIELVDALVGVGCPRIVFSSSAAVYAASPSLVVDERAPLDPRSPYAVSKAMVERVLQDVVAAHPVRALALRYFNPVGADPQMRTGLQVAHPSHVLGSLLAAHEAGRPFTVHGSDWPTRDGSPVRDYVHVWDLAQAHVLALAAFDDVCHDASPFTAVNIGSGTGTTVLELADAFADVVGQPVEVVRGPRREGDVVGGAASSDRARELLGWKPELSLRDAIGDALRWREVRGERLGV